MRNRVNVCFWFRKERGVLEADVTPETRGAIYCRISVARQLGRVDFPTGIISTKQEWDVKAKRLLDKQAANNQLIKLEDDLRDIHAELERRRRPVTAASIRRQYLKGSTTALSLLDLVERYLTERELLVGLEITLNTVQCDRYRVMLLQRFLRESRWLDMRPEEFTMSQGDRLLLWWLRQGYSRAQGNKLVGFVLQVLNWGVRRELIDFNPLQGYKMRSLQRKPIQYLLPEQVQQLAAYDFEDDTLNKVRDCFVFQCWTGLAYADLAALRVDQAAHKIKGWRVLRVRRAKSTLFQGYDCVIPLLPEPVRILARYNDILPVYSRHYYNAILKEVGRVMGLPEEKMHSHVGRKTAGVLLLNAGLRMETVSRALGHASVTTTQRLYAELLDTTVVEEFEAVFGRQNMIGRDGGGIEAVV